MLRRLLLGGVAFSCLALAAEGADWPQWRGPHRDGISDETGLLKEWPKEGPTEVWHDKAIGDGYSTPAVVGERLYLISNKGMDNEFVEARNVADGKPAWTKTIGKVGRNLGPQYPGSRSTPTVDGQRLFALGSNGDLACLEIAGGNPVWTKSLRTDFGGRPGMWAYSESPLVDGDVLVCTPGGSEATMVALNKNTGETIWKMSIPNGDQAAYASAIIMDVGGIKQYVQFLHDGLVGVDAKTGKVLWRYGRTAKGSPANIPTPVAHADYVYSSTGRGGGGLVQLKAEDGKMEAKQVYYNPRLPTSIGGSVERDGFLYGTGSQGLECVEFATGTVKWQERGIGAAAICYADGRLYLHGENGKVALVDAKSDAYHEQGRFSPNDEPKRGKSKAWAYPVVANGRLYIRDLGSLWCYDVREKQVAK